MLSEIAIIVAVLVYVILGLILFISLLIDSEAYGDSIGVFGRPLKQHILLFLICPYAYLCLLGVDLFKIPISIAYRKLVGYFNA